MSLSLRNGLGMGAGGGAKSSPLKKYIKAMATPPTGSSLDHLGTLINGLIADGNFSEVFDQLLVLALDSATPGDSLINAISPGTMNATIINSLNTYVAKTGWVGAAAKGINTNYVPDGSKKFKITDASNCSMMMMVYTLNTFSGSSSALFGAISTIEANNVRYLVYQTSTSSIYALSDLVANDKSHSVSQTKGMYAVARDNNANILCYKPDGTVNSVASNTILRYPQHAPFITCRNNNGSVELANTSARIGVYGIGMHPGADRMASISARIDTYLTAIGAYS